MNINGVVPLHFDEERWKRLSYHKLELAESTAAPEKIAWTRQNERDLATHHRHMVGVLSLCDKLVLFVHRLPAPIQNLSIYTTSLFSIGLEKRGEQVRRDSLLKPLKCSTLPPPPLSIFKPC